MTRSSRLPAQVATVPCRVNLIGEWIDFNGGTVLPMALAPSVTVQLAANGMTLDRIRSTNFEAIQDFSVDAPAEGHWSDYVRGALQYARDQNWIQGGQDLSVHSTIPVGAGLSSSAAIIVATLKAASIGNGNVDGASLASAAKKIENDFIGVPCGIMDQMAVALGEPGVALALHTRDCSYALLSLPETWAIVVIHSGVNRALSDGRYRIRRDQCLAAAAALGVEYLCDADLVSITTLDDPLRRRARHAATEAKRSLDAIAALRAGDRSRFGQLMIESHDSLRDDMDVSVQEVDQLVQDAVRLGADGARITGAGFGGCIVALVDPDHVETWWSALKLRHPSIARVA
ncbi:galactokinase [Hyphomonas johnsonii]|uniref:Galactokinase n=1 Tax=Hyphomonas johnsonii MHS-2 TaxID=1280950 RepID=A0A059FSE2_9PROT|nr:galactokinase [Hyphomonas johnsonii]KCZ93393.1 galactokinase [Hyphomonas johnsonii MHS-2]